MEMLFMETKQYKASHLATKTRLIDKYVSSTLVYLLYLEKYRTTVYKQ